MPRALLPGGGAGGGSPGTSPRSRPTWAGTTSGPPPWHGAARDTTSSWSWPPTGRACSRGSPASLSLAGLSILTAQVFTTEDGAAVDLFEVQGVVRGRRSRKSDGVSSAGPLRKAIDGADVAGAPGGREAPPLPGASIGPARDGGGGQRRVGLLHGDRGRRAGSHRGCSTTSPARSPTCSSTCTSPRSPRTPDRVIDAFYVRDALGRKITSPEQIAEVESAMRGRLEG